MAESGARSPQAARAVCKRNGCRSGLVSALLQLLSARGQEASGAFLPLHRPEAAVRLEKAHLRTAGLAAT